MAKFKPAGLKKAKAPGSNRGLVPCLLLVAVGFGLIFLLLYLLLQSGH